MTSILKTFLVLAVLLFSAGLLQQNSALGFSAAGYKARTTRDSNYSDNSEHLYRCEWQVPPLLAAPVRLKPSLALRNHAHPLKKPQI